MELLAQRADEYGFTTWSIKKEVLADAVSIIVEEIKDSREPEVLKAIKYSRLIPEYESPFLNWENLIFCSNSYGPPPLPEYMHSAVQEGKKTAATVYLNPQSPEAQELTRTLPDDCDYCDFNHSDCMFFVFHKGCLADFFDLNIIKSTYNAHGILGIDWSWVAEQFQKPLSFFANPKQCGFSLQSGGGRREAAVVTGLILGYPIESTIAAIGRRFC